MPDNPAESVGQEVKRRRVALNMTQKALSAAAGVDRGAVIRVEAGRSYHEATLMKLRGALAQLEKRHGISQPEQVVGVHELADGTRVSFSGSPEAVVVALRAYLGESPPSPQS
jgi:transcriptional regulator with XRE-family HTH domain